MAETEPKAAAAETVKKEEEKKADEKMEVKDEKKEGEEKKEDPKDEAEVLKSVVERLKFFFSDANVRQDLFIRRFLLPREPEENKDCSVPIETLLRFNTIKQHTDDAAVVIKAVNEHMSDKLVLKDDDKAIARVKPFTKELVNENIPLSLYVTNLPVKEEDGKYGKRVSYDVSMDGIRQLFDTYGEVAMVKLRFKRSARSDDDHHTDDIKMEENPPKDGGGTKKPRRRFPLNSCMVEFDNLEAHGKAAEDVLTKKGDEQVEPKRKLELGGQTLEVVTLQEYVETLRKRKRERGDDNDDKKQQQPDDEALKFTIDWKPGCVVSIKGLPEACDREAILGAVAAVCEITLDELKEKKIYADYSRGQKDGAIRFNEPELATKMCEKLKSGDTKICDTDIKEAAIIEGDEEKKYWENFIEFSKKRIRHRNEERKHKHNHHNKRRKGGPRKGGGYQTMQS